MQAKPWLVPLVALLLAGCGGSDGGSATLPTPAPPTTVSALAVSQISAETCDTHVADAVDGRTFMDDQQATDVTTLKPACSSP